MNAGDGQRSAVHDSMLSGRCVVRGASISRSVLYSNVRVRPHAVLEDCVVLPDVQIGSGCRIRHAGIDKRRVVAKDTEIGAAADADARRFTVSPAGVVLVTPDMPGRDVHRVR